MMSQAQSILKKYWGYDQFRPLQEDIIYSILDSQDTLAILPTGGGKSICFQVPGMIFPGLTLVISPLIALMQDQVDQLKKRGIKAVAIHSGLSNRQIDILLDNCIYDEIKFLYISPERLKTPLFLARAEKMNISLLAIDEAHCISQWGYDFRPPYLEIKKFRESYPKIPCIALTASATLDVQDDIKEKLGFKSDKHFQKSFIRKNLSYSVLFEENKEKKILEILRKVPGSGIIYVRNRKKCKEIAEFLQSYQISADYYHAGVDSKTRSGIQNKWINNQIRIIVATNAFGMGIDKPDVRIVIHIDLPDSIEAYYQEAGRAGRDEKKAYAALLLQNHDLEDLKTNFEKNFPSKESIQRTYQAMANFLQIPEGSGENVDYDFNWIEMCKRFNLSPLDTHFSLKALDQEGLIVLNEQGLNNSLIQVIVSSTELYDFQLRNERYESFIKLLLRIYGGNIYNEFVPVYENELAKSYKSNPNEIINLLELLEKFEIIHYQKSTGSPRLTLSHPRANVNNIPFNWLNYKERKKREAKKIEGILHYSQTKNVCRSRHLAIYFGEITDNECGICDVCNNKKPLNPEKKLNELRDDEIIRLCSFLKNGPLNIDSLVASMQPLSAKEVIKIIQRSLDKELIHYIELETLALNSD
ncbi:MAG: helicase [Bacteroidota bacterium]